MKKKKKEAIAAESIYFPEEILENIFIRLPRRSLMRFRCVCKYFNALFGRWGFQNINHELSNYIMASGEEELRKIDYKSVSSLLPLLTSSETTCEEFNNQMNYRSVFLDCLGINQMDYRSIFVHPLASCDGLVWIRLFKAGFEDLYPSGKYYIWNPTTNGCEEEIPMVPDRKYITGYGFCYDYKLVTVVVYRDPKCSDVKVNKLGSNSWETILSIPYKLGTMQSKEGVLCNGALHWLAHTLGDKSTVLVSIDIVKKRFQEVATPELPKLYPEEPLDEEMFERHLGVFGGCLCLVFHVYNVCVDLWIMQDYGAKESWTKSFSITQESIINTMWRLKLVWSFKNNETLWEVDEGLVLYDPNNKTYRKLMWDLDYAEGIFS